jgi:sulfide:quinone oxidoreductase
MRIVVLGAGFGGLELATSLSEQHGDALDVVLVDQTEGFTFGFAKLDVIFGRSKATEVRHQYSRINKPGLRFVQATVLAIDPHTRQVQTDAGSFDADILVVALGADLDASATPGLVEGGFDFYSESGAEALAAALPQFGGGSVVVGVTSTPFKCPPAASEAALLMHDYLTDRGLRGTSEICLVMPFGVPVPPSPAASAALLEAFAERGIEFVPGLLVAGLDSGRQQVLLSDGTSRPYDLFLGVPRHHVPAVVEQSGLAVDGWIPVDPYTLQTSFPDVYAVGDVTSVGTAKAGVFAEGQAKIVAQQISARVNGGVAQRYDGHGTCYLEFGGDQVGQVDVTFVPGQPPSGILEGPSTDLVAHKAHFGTSRVARWFG